MSSTTDAGAAPDPVKEILREVDDLLDRHPPGRAPDRSLRAARFDAGLAFPAFRPGDGGRTSQPALTAAIEGHFVAGGAESWADRNVIGLGMAAPTIHDHGSRQQRERWLRPLFTGEEIWCQLFSEPGSGSDLAGLATSARPDGDEWRVNGQKVWTTLAHHARWGLLLARTDPTVPKHRGLTYFCLDMTSPGVEVRPLRQMTGDAEFNEVYLTDVRIPDAHRLGDIGQGWRVAMTTLMNERVSLGSVVSERSSGPIGQAVDTFGRAAGRAADRHRLARLWGRAEVGRLTNLRAAGQGARPGPEGSVAKLQTAELNKDVYDLCVDLLGPAGLVVSGYEMTRPDSAGVHGGNEIPKAFLRSRANTIEGGTAEVLRNVLAERVLGLPGEPRSDNALPWTDVPRS